MLSNEAIVLYRNVFRLSRQFPNPSMRSYLKQRIRAAYRHPEYMPKYLVYEEGIKQEQEQRSDTSSTSAETTKTGSGGPWQSRIVEQNEIIQHVKQVVIPVWQRQAAIARLYQ